MLIAKQMATEMLKSIADYQPIDFQGDIVTCYLVEHFLRNLHTWRFVLDNHDGFAFIAEDHRIASFLHLPNAYLYFVTDSSRRILMGSDQEIHEVLSYPFFGRQSHPF